VTTSATASVPALTPNTTYYGQVNSIINGSSSPYSAYVTTATLAVIPTTAVSTWTVNITSLTVSWQNGANPVDVTKYVVDLSTDSGFAPVATASSETYLLNGTFFTLVPDATYYAQVKAVNHSEIPTNYLALGSTKTLQTPIPTNLTFTAAAATNLTASWTAPNPAGTPTPSVCRRIQTSMGF